MGKALSDITVQSLSLKNKILLLVIVPLFLVSLILASLFVFQIQKLGDKNIANFSQTVFKLRQDELRNYTELALSSVQHHYLESGKDQEETQNLAKVILRNLSYGSDGYFFVYDFSGTNITHPKKPQLEGQNLYELEDANGVPVIQSLIEMSKLPTGGVTKYLWGKPSAGRVAGKIGYSMALDD